jgi:Cu(I)/Ag(I) efflux system membrane fusion protein
VIRATVMPDGTPGPTGVEGKYICPMHPYIVSDGPGKCSVCKMPLERVPGEPTPEGGPLTPEVLAVPASAVLTTGERQLVYVEREPGVYYLMEPKLGPRAGQFYPVLGGLSPGDRVVVRGGFLLDSQFQIAGHPSLLYPTGIAGGGTGHAGHRAEVSPEEPSKPHAPREGAHSAHRP